VGQRGTTLTLQRQQSQDVTMRVLAVRIEGQPAPRVDPRPVVLAPRAVIVDQRVQSGECQLLPVFTLLEQPDLELAATVQIDAGHEFAAVERYGLGQPRGLGFADVWAGEPWVL